MYSIILFCAFLAQCINAVTTVRITQQIQLTRTVYRSTASASDTAEAEVTLDYASAPTLQHSHVVAGAPSKTGTEESTASEVAYPDTTAATSTTDIAEKKPRVIVMGSITLTAGGVPQTMSNKQYSLDECHLFIGTAAATLCSSNNAPATAVVTSASKSRVAWPASSTSSFTRVSDVSSQAVAHGSTVPSGRLASDYAGAGGVTSRPGTATTPRPYLLGTGCVRWNDTGYGSSVGVLVTASRSSTVTSRTRLPCSSSSSAADQASSTTQSNGNISKGAGCRGTKIERVVLWSAAAAALTRYWWV